MSEQGLFTADLMGPCMLVHCPEALTTDTIIAFETESKNWLSDAVKVIVLDFKETTILSNTVYRHLILFAQEVRKRSKYLISYRAKAGIQEQLHHAGLDEALGLTDNLGEKLKELEKSSVKKPTIDVDFINPFMGAVQKVLDTQARTKISAAKPYVQENAPQSLCDIVAATHFSGAQFQGVATLGFTKASILEVYQNMMGRVETEISAMIADCVKELLNIIFNSAVAEMSSKTGQRFKMGEIKVYIGMEVPQERPVKRIIFPFQSAKGKLHLEISVPKSV